MLAVRHADRRGGNAHQLLVLFTIPVLAIGVIAVAASLERQTIAAVYLGFLGALAIWGWIELTFMAGIVVGPVRTDCPPRLTTTQRFFRAFGTVSHHEVLLTFGLICLVLYSADAPNRMAMATYLILYLARIFAKLNLFYGVPRINMEFMPDRLKHLKSYFRQGPVKPVFAVAITTLTALVVVCAERLLTASTPVTTAGFALLTALSALALLEHWLMVVPLPDAKLWRWMLPAPKLSIDEEGKTNGF